VRPVLIWASISSALLLAGLFMRSLQGPVQGVCLMGLLLLCSGCLLFRIIRGA
jgi:hypothetical protein